MKIYSSKAFFLSSWMMVLKRVLLKSVLSFNNFYFWKIQSWNFKFCCIWSVDMILLLIFTISMLILNAYKLMSNYKILGTYSSMRYILFRFLEFKVGKIRVIRPSSLSSGKICPVSSWNACHKKLCQKWHLRCSNLYHIR